MVRRKIANLKIAVQLCSQPAPLYNLRLCRLLSCMFRGRYEGLQSKIVTYTILDRAEPLRYKRRRAEFGENNGYNQRL